MQVDYKRSFLKDIRKIKDRNIRGRLEKVLHEIESAKEKSEITGLDAMTGSPAYYKIRIGGYRLGLKIIENEVAVIRFLGRGEIYKKFP